MKTSTIVIIAVVVIIVIIAGVFAIMSFNHGTPTSSTTSSSSSMSSISSTSSSTTTTPTTTSTSSMSSSTSSSSTTTSSTSTTSSTTTTSTTTTTTSTTTSSTLPPGAYQLQYNPSNKTVFIYLVVQGSSLNYNGTSNGQMRIYVPAGWNVLVKLTNPQSLPHNALIVLNNTVKPNNLNISADGKIMLYVGANATDYYGNGIYGGQSAVGVLPNIPAGYYWIACGIYSHAESGMWVVLVASNSVTVPYAIVIS